MGGSSRLAHGATFGDVVAIAGQASDIALDEPRGVLYIANFTAGRIDVLSLSDKTIHSSLHVPSAPAALALSRDGRYLVVTHFGNVTAPGTPSNAISVLDLSGGVRQTYALSSPPLGVAFGSDGLALVATTTEFLTLDPSIGRTDLLQTVANLTANQIPASPGTTPLEIVAAALASSGDGKWIFGVTDSIRISYDVANRHLQVTGYSATPTLGPRVVTVAQDGSYFAAGWGLFDREGTLVSQFPGASGALGFGSLVLDSVSGTLYAQISKAGGGGATVADPPLLQVVDADNLTVRQRILLAENLAGRAVLNSRADTVYSVSESGVMVLPVGSLNQYHRLAADHEDLVFRGDFCQRGGITQTVTISDPGGAQTAFSLSSDLSGVTISPSSGRSPATVKITIDPHLFQDRRGTVSGSLTISSSEAVNLLAPIRILVTNQRPDERGFSSDVPGTLSDLLADSERDRFYVVRQDRNQVLVFDGSGLFQIAQLRTANTPTRLAVTADRKTLLVGHENSQLIYLYDLDTLTQMQPVVMPRGHYPRSVAVSGNAILAASRVAGTVHTIDRIDLASRTAVELPSLGVFKNSVDQDTALIATPNGGEIVAASADGTVWLYEAAADTFTVSRRLPDNLAGSFAASNSGQYAVGNYFLNASLKPITTWTGSDFPAGFAFQDNHGLRLTGPPTATGAGGSLQRVTLSGSAVALPTRVVEQPLASGGVSVFTRALAPLSNGKTLIALSISGFTALPWNFDTPTAPPAISSVVNAADLTATLAPGSLIAVFGSNLNPTNAATSEIPLPTAIGQSCLIVNGTAIPMMFASPGQINAQLPLRVDGRVPITLYTPGGASDDYYLNITSAAPAVFHSGAAGPLTGLPVVVKAANQQLVTASNPVHPNDQIWIYATGLGATSPEVEAGSPGPVTMAPAIQVPDVRLGDTPLAIAYAGLAPGQVGVYWINVRVPDKVTSGTDVPLSIRQGGITATVSVRVVE